MQELAEINGSLSAIGYGLAAIGPGVGVGLVFSSYINSSARQPASARANLPYLFLGMALIEALALFGLAMGFAYT